MAEKRIECELIEERYWERDPSFLRRNPAAKVPVLEIDGKIMSESAAICEYLEEKYPNPALMPVDIHQRYEVRRLVGWFDDKFHRDVTSKLVYERVTKKIMGQGYPDSKNVKDGAKKDKISSRLYCMAFGTTELAGGRYDELGRFCGGGASLGAGLHI